MQKRKKYTTKQRSTRKTDNRKKNSLASVARPKELKSELELAIKNKFVEERNKLLDMMLNYGLIRLDMVKNTKKKYGKYI